MSILRLAFSRRNCNRGTSFGSQLPFEATSPTSGRSCIEVMMNSLTLRPGSEEGQDKANTTRMLHTYEAIMILRSSRRVPVIGVPDPLRAAVLVETQDSRWLL